MSARPAIALAISAALSAFASGCPPAPEVPEGGCPSPPAAARREAPDQFVQTSHWGPVRALAFSDDGSYLASASEDHSVRVWQTSTRHAVRVFLTRPKVGWLEFDGSNRLLVDRHGIPDVSLAPLLLDVSEGAALAVLGNHIRVRPYRGSDPLERWIAAGSKKVALYGADGAKRRYANHSCRRIDIASVSPGGDALALFCDDRDDDDRAERGGDEGGRAEGGRDDLRIFSRTRSGPWTERRVPAPFYDGKGAAELVASRGAATVVVKTYRDDELHVLRGGSWRQLAKDPLEGPLRALAVSPDGELVVAVADNLVAWSASDGGVAWSKQDLRYAVERFSPDGRWLAAGGFDGRILLYDARSGRTLGAFGAKVQRAERIALPSDDEVIVDADGQRTTWSLRDAAPESRGDIPKNDRAANRKAAHLRRGDLSDDDGAADESPVAKALRSASGEDEAAVHGRPGIGALRDAIPGDDRAADRRLGLDALRKRIPPGIEVATAAVETPDAGLLVGTSEGDLVVVRDDEEVARGPSDGLAIHSIVVSPSGAIAATISLDGAVRIWDARDATLRAMLFDFVDGEWLVASPRGAYTGSREVSTRIGWVFDEPLEFHSFEQYRDTFRNPELVRRRLAGEPVEAAAELVRPPRIISIEAPDDVVRRHEAVIKVALHKPNRARVVRAFAEGRLVDSHKVCAPQHRAELTVPLVAGVNRITLLAFDTQGHASSPVTVDVTADVPRRPSVWVVAVGVSRYTQLPDSYQLEVADDDAMAIGEAFRGLAGAGKPFERAHITVLRDQQVTVTGVRRALSSLAAMKRDDVAVVSFAGHGMNLPKGDMVFLTTHATLDEPARAGLRWTMVSELLSRARGRVLLLLDACHAGHFTDQVARNESLAALLSRGQRAGVLVFAASKGRQLSYEVSGARDLRYVRNQPDGVLRSQPDADAKPNGDADPAHGLFTGALLRSLDTSITDRNGDGALQVSEVIDEVTRRVIETSRGRQTPWVARREMFGDFKLSDTKRPAASKSKE